MRKRKNLKKKNEESATNNSSIVTRSVAKGVIILVFLMLLCQSTYFLLGVVKEIKESNKLVAAVAVDSISTEKHVSSFKSTYAGKSSYTGKSTYAGKSDSVRKYTASKRTASIVDSISNVDSTSSTLNPISAGKHTSTDKRVVANIAPDLLFKFDPNLSTMSELVHLGFSPKQAAVILRWREAGGSFRRKEDFKKMYVVSDSVYKRLEPYIVIMPNPSDIVDINSADSARLVSIRGIGPYYAKSILKYRSEIGYFVRKEQLMEIYGINQDVYDKIQAYIKVSAPSDSLKKLHCNIFNLSLEQLAANPYIGSYAARGIDRYRRIVKDSSKFTIDNLLKNGVITQDQAKKLKYYSK